MLVHKKTYIHVVYFEYSLHICLLAYLVAVYFPREALITYLTTPESDFMKNFCATIYIIAQNDDNANKYELQRRSFIHLCFGKNADLLAPQSSPGPGLKAGQDQMCKL